MSLLSISITSYSYHFLFLNLRFKAFFLSFLTLSFGLIFYYKELGIMILKWLISVGNDSNKHKIMTTNMILC